MNISKQDLEKALEELWDTAVSVPNEDRWTKGVIDACKTLADRFELTLGKEEN